MPKFKRFNDKDKDKRKKKKKMFQKKRVCRFCVNPEYKIDYKDTKLLGSFITERGKIVPRRYSGNCAKHQRAINIAIKRGRLLALIPFTATQIANSM